MKYFSKIITKKCIVCNIKKRSKNFIKKNIASNINLKFQSLYIKRCNFPFLGDNINSITKTENCINNDNIGEIKSQKQESENMKKKIHIGASEQNVLWVKYEKLKREYKFVLSTSKFYQDCQITKNN